MPRKNAKKIEPDTDIATATAAEPELAAAPSERPAYIDGPPVTEQGDIATPKNPDAKNWGDPYKAIVTTPGFEMGENRRFKQWLFMFKEKPTEEVLAALKEAGFTYRANEKAWTIQATPDGRVISDQLAQQFAGSSLAMSR